MGGQHWSIPHKVYKYLNNTYNINYVGFASPLNICKIEGIKFCSIFKDTDEVFGSLGSFFNIDINYNQDHELLRAKKWEAIINKIIDKPVITRRAS